MTTNQLQTQQQPETDLSKEAFPTLELLQRPSVEQAAEDVAAYLERNLESFRVAIAQVSTLPTRINYNVERICEWIDKAVEANAEVVVFPELAIPGYASLDQFRDERYIDANIEGLRKVTEHTRGKDITVIVGFADKGAEKEDPSIPRDHYNSAAIIRDGNLEDIVDKTLIPEYDVFFEGRYYKPGRKNEPVEVAGRTFGVEICEDLWDRDYQTKVSDNLASQDPDLLVNLSASPVHPGKVGERAELIADLIERHGIPFVYANLVGAQDGYEGELVFDGRSMIHDASGNLISIGEGFKEELVVVDLYKGTPIPLPTWKEVEEVHQTLVLGIKEYFRRTGFEKAYIGLSGGIDSAVTAALAVEALGAENVIGITMPSHVTSEETKSDAILLAENLGIECITRPIGKMYQAWLEDAEASHGGELDSVTKQNAQARFRMQILMEYTNEDRKGIVLSTGNKTELALGYCTLYGDMAGGLAAISDVDKLMVYELAREINRTWRDEIIPVTTIERPPTAELEEGQLDKENLPADYDVLAPLVDEIVEDSASRAELIARYPEEVVDRTLAMINVQEFKRRQSANGIRATKKAFGSGRRFPIDNKFIP